MLSPLNLFFFKAEALNLQLQYETVPSSKFRDLVYWRFYLTSPDFELIQILVPDRRLDNGWALQVTDIHEASRNTGNAVGIVAAKGNP